MHPHKQSIPCLACGKRLPSTAMVIKHIENGQCDITLQEWRLERAERAVAKEAFLERYEQNSASYIAPMSDGGSQNGGVSLLDSDPNIPSRGAGPQDTNGDHTSIMSMDEIAESLSRTGIDSQSDWQQDRGSMPISQAQPVTGSHLSEAKSTNLSYASTTFKLSDFWCPIRELFVCPGSNCGEVFAKAEDFHAHLSGPAHVGGNATCPSCLKHFATNYALLCHMEAPSRKCNIRHSVNYNQVLREVTAGLVGTGGHFGDGAVKYIMPEDEGWKA